MDAKTFDLASALQGRTYPREVVSVFFDEAKSYELSKLDKAIARDTENAGLLEKRDAFIKEFESERVQVHVVGVPRHVQSNLVKTILSEYPGEKNAFGLTEPNPEADNAFANKKWAAHIEKIVAPGGGEKTDFTEEDAQMFRDYAPDATIDAIEKAIENLTAGAKSGYETAIQDIDFLSRP